MLLIFKFFERLFYCKLYFFKDYHIKIFQKTVGLLHIDTSPYEVSEYSLVPSLQKINGQCVVASHINFLIIKGANNWAVKGDTRDC